MSKLSLVGGDAGIGEVLLHAPETDETRIYDFPDETGTFALREYDIRNLDEAKANRAGDTFTGALAVRLAEGKPLREALRYANAAAAITVTRRGALASIPTRQEVLEKFGF